MGERVISYGKEKDHPIRARDGSSPHLPPCMTRYTVIAFILMYVESMSNAPLSIGRWLFAIPFFVFGLFHLFASQQLAGLVPGFFPGNPRLWVIVTGLIFLATSLSIALQKMQRNACMLLAIQLTVFILTVWLPQLGGEAAQLAMPNMLKDIALLGATLTFMSISPKEQSPAPSPTTPS